MSNFLPLFDHLISTSKHGEYAISIYINNIYNATCCVGAIDCNSKIFYKIVDCDMSQIVIPSNVTIKTKCISSESTIHDNNIELVWKITDRGYDYRYSDDLYMDDYKAMLESLNNLDYMFFKGTLIIKKIEGFKSNTHHTDNFIIKLPYNETIELINPTIKQFINSLWLVKSNKINVWHQFYCSAKIFINASNTCIVCRYDHDS